MLKLREARLCSFSLGGQNIAEAADKSDRQEASRCTNIQFPLKQTLNQTQYIVVLKTKTVIDLGKSKLDPQTSFSMHEYSLSWPNRFRIQQNGTRPN